MFIIRDYQNCDDEELADVFSLTYSESSWGEQWEKKVALSYLREYINTPGFGAFICEKEKRIIAGVLFVTSHWYSGTRIEIKELFVLPSYQNKGIGKELINRVISTASSNGIQEVFLWTHRDQRLLEFYTECGLITDRDLITMRIVLNGGES